ncbi:MAG: hypothetical protein NTY59_10875 [Alphaproteobacteria bacterium]|nr:hypothetical protein [Alphaproteobacteria bacterium]
MIKPFLAAWGLIIATASIAIAGEKLPDVWSVNYPTGKGNKFPTCSRPSAHLYLTEPDVIQFSVFTTNDAKSRKCSAGKQEIFLIDFFAKTEKRIDRAELSKFHQAHSAGSVYLSSGRPFPDYRPWARTDSWERFSKEPYSNGGYIARYAYITPDNGRVIIQEHTGRAETVCDFTLKSRLMRVEPDGTISKILYAVALIPGTIEKERVVKNCDPEADPDDDVFVPVSKTVEGFTLILTKLGDETYLVTGYGMPTAVRFDEKLNSPGFATSSVYWLQQKELDEAINGAPVETTPLLQQKLLVKILKEKARRSSEKR